MSFMFINKDTNLVIIVIDFIVTTELREAKKVCNFMGLVLVILFSLKHLCFPDYYVEVNFIKIVSVKLHLIY